MTVCTGNICRSPMGEVILRSFFHDAGLDEFVSVDSTGVSDEEHGHPIDPRAQKVLREYGYEVPEHHARQITMREIETTDLLLPMTAEHKYRLERLAQGRNNGEIRLYRSFDPKLTVPSSPFDDSIDLIDPWFGGPEDFKRAIAQIVEVAPFIVDYVKQQIEIE
jgi:protein-tyrosine phosphatase